MVLIISQHMFCASLKKRHSRFYLVWLLSNGSSCKIEQHSCTSLVAYVSSRWAKVIFPECGLPISWKCYARWERKADCGNVVMMVCFGIYCSVNQAAITDWVICRKWCQCDKLRADHSIKTSLPPGMIWSWVAHMAMASLEDCLSRWMPCQGQTNHLCGHTHSAPLNQQVIRSICHIQPKYERTVKNGGWMNDAYRKYCGYINICQVIRWKLISAHSKGGGVVQGREIDSTTFETNTLNQLIKPLKQCRSYRV